MRIYTLVGKSGTGKSFHAMDLCRKENIESIIDDGLYIYIGIRCLPDPRPKEPAPR